MAYIGFKPVQGNAVVDEFISTGGSTYTLSSEPSGINSIEIVVGGLTQTSSAYSVSGTTLTIAGVPSGTKIIARQHGEKLELPAPADGTVTDAKIVDMAASKLTGTISDTQIAAMAASKLTGALPTISGANLTNLPASGKQITESSSDPVITTNPVTGVGTLWLNTTSGTMWCCTDATNNENAWMSVGEGATLNVTVPVPYDVHFLVVAGGGAGSSTSGQMTGGGGGGGFRTSWAGGSGGGGVSESQTALIEGQTYTITVGAGGAADSESGVPSSIIGTSVSITSAGGGAAALNPPSVVSTSGGSGGGGAPFTGFFAGGSGTANQGYDGGTSNVWGTGTPFAGGGGAAETGHGQATHGNLSGGAGKQVNIDNNNYYFAGGGGGAVHVNNGASQTSNGGIGGGGYGMGYTTSPKGSAGGSAITSDAASNGGTNTGGGAGGTTWYSGATGSAGGSGCVILRIPTANYTGTTTGNPSETVVSSDTVLTFTGTGTYSA